MGRLAALCGGIACLALCAGAEQAGVGHSEITRWQDGSRAAVSITYDGGTINQFRVAVPIMDELGFKATFFIVTGDITGSRHLRKFIGRPPGDILRESATVPLSPDNFFERATALRFLDYRGAAEAHTRAGDLFELGKAEQARALVAEAYAKIRAGEWPALDPATAHTNPTVDISWDALKEIAARGHEFGSHSVSHPQPGICDDANLRYELEMSRAELVSQLGERHAFSAELPHGVEDPRALECAFALYPALRNRMPEPYLQEINRWNKTDPTTSTREYVQWQRGPKTSTTLEQMDSWVDTCLTRDNIWLVLTFHGVDGIGYEPKTGAEVRGFFRHIKSAGDKVWVTTFQDATKYIRERMNGSADGVMEEGRIRVTLRHRLDPAMYDLPLTVRTRVPEEWSSVDFRQGAERRRLQAAGDGAGRSVLYRAIPNGAPVELSRAAD